MISHTYTVADQGGYGSKSSICHCICMMLEQNRLASKLTDQFFMVRLWTRLRWVKPGLWAQATHSLCHTTIFHYCMKKTPDNIAKVETSLMYLIYVERGGGGVLYSLNCRNCISHKLFCFKQEPLRNLNAGGGVNDFDGESKSGRNLEGHPDLTNNEGVSFSWSTFREKLLLFNILNCSKKYKTI